MTLSENTIICGDTHHLIHKVEDESIDLIICDGPYGVTQNQWDKVSSIQEFNLKLIRQYSRKLKEGGT